MIEASRIVDVDENETPEQSNEEIIASMKAPPQEDKPVTQVDAELKDAQTKQAIEDLPEKFKGKSVHDLVEMYTNLEKHTGRQGQELGELRKITDQILHNQFVEKEERQEPEVKPDFFDDPESAVKQLVEKELAPLRQEKEKTKQQQFQKNLEDNFPDYEQILSNPEFAEWVQSSPYRLKMYEDADIKWDWGAANELLSTYKAVHVRPEPTQEQPPEEAKAKRDAELKAASVEKGSTGETTRKVFRRTDLMRLLQTDPEKYYSLEAEIRKAYAEGRVR